MLPGNIQAFVDAPIYARTNGYLKRWYFDIGSHVKQGQLLAEIESPEVDQQLSQAQADLGTATANLHLSQITANRFSDLIKQDAVSQQDTDNAVSDLAAKNTAVKSAQANVDRLKQLVSFEKVYAPFDGVVTARNTDIGQLIDSGAAGGQARVSVSDGGHQQAEGLYQCAADLFAGGHSGLNGRSDVCRVSRSTFSGQAGADFEIDRPYGADVECRSRCRQREGRAASGRLYRGSSEVEGRHTHFDCSGERTSISPGGFEGRSRAKATIPRSWYRSRWAATLAILPRLRPG